MKYLELTIQIPEPRKDGHCSRRCTGQQDLHYGKAEWCVFDLSKYREIHAGRAVHINGQMRPGPGCPWYDEGEASDE